MTQSCGQYDVDGQGAQNRLFVVGPATGRWARTRPVWHELAYDITSVRDDGVIISFPYPSWSTYNAFRAQPAHDGLHPDRVIDATGVCADACDDGYDAYSSGRGAGGALERLGRPEGSGGHGHA